MLSTLLFSGLSQTALAAFDNVQERLPQVQEPELRRADSSEDVVLGSSLWATKGSSPMDGLVVYIRAQADATKYKMLSADGNAKGCSFKTKYSDSSDKSSEQLWKLVSTGETVGNYDYYFLRNLAHDDIRMSYYWDDQNTDSPYLSMTCGKNMADRHHWIFEESSSSGSDDKSYQIVNRVSGAQTYCRLTSEEDTGNGVFSDDDEYVCSRGTSNMNHDSTLDTVYSFRQMMGWGTDPLVGACSNGRCTPQDTADGVRDFKLINPYNSEAGWDVVAGAAIEVNGEIDWTYTYKTGISNTITSTSAKDSSYSVSVSASVGASAFGMDVSTEVATSFGQSFSSSYSSGLTLETATTVTLEILVPANTCVELLQLYSITENQFEEASFQFKSNQLKLRCCVGTESQNPEYCNSESLAHLPSGDLLSNYFTGEASE